MVKKIYIDTDNGDDIDDLLAIYMALAIKDIEVVGFSTVYLNTNLRARQINKVLQLKNKNIPVYAGIGTPLKGMHFNTTNVKYCQFSDDLLKDKYAPINEIEKNHGLSAIDFMIECAKKYQDELTIVCIGPLTNLAYAILKDKEAFKNVKIVMMGGCFFSLEREWNIECDIQAATIVFESNLDISCIGIDVTKKVEITSSMQKHYINAIHSDDKKYLVECINKWVDTTKRRIILHDPLTLYYAINQEVCKMKDVYVYVENKDEITQGLTINMEKLMWVQFDEKVKKNFCKYKCAYKVKKEEFIEIFNDLVKI